jgi:DNA-binding CsgD family transcriptional regulator
MGIVLFGDVADSRRDSARASTWLRTLTTALDRAYGPERLARFGFTQGDELQGVLRTSADPLAAVLRAALDPAALPMRWAIAAGPIDPGHGPTTQRTGQAFLSARDALAEARRRREGLVIRSGAADLDTILDDAAPALAVLLAELSDRQREVARLMLVAGLRQADVAERLAIARPTVSVAADRAHVREIRGLAQALTALLGEGLSRAAGATTGAG